MIRAFRFAAGDVPCEVLVGDGALVRAARKLARVAPGGWLAVSSRPVMGLHGAVLGELAEASGGRVDAAPVLVPDGEAGKTWKALGILVERLVARDLRRDGGVLALGGGTVGDVAGLAASLALRGVPVVQVPTTLLAAADSALGGKTAVNLDAGKNLAGTFHQPALVVVEPRLLATLPARELRSGLAEVVKTSMLDRTLDRAMRRLSASLERHDLEALAEAILLSLRFKARVVAEDPLERSGVRFLLNLGHTAGHALETASAGRLRHGEAVAWGLLAILEVSVARRILDSARAEELSRRVVSLVNPPALGRETLLRWIDYLRKDKKSDRSGLRAVLLAGPGRTVVDRVSAPELARGLNAAVERYNREL